jgi:hypothetical protein
MNLWVIECRAPDEKRWRILRIEYWKSSADRIMKLFSKPSRFEEAEHRLRKYSPVQYRGKRYVRIEHRGTRGKKYVR